MSRTPGTSIRTTLVDGRKVVATAGTAEALSATSVPVISVDITAGTANTGIVTVGASTVVAAVGTRRGVPLAAGNSWSEENVDLKDIFLDVTVNGEGVSFVYVRGGV